MLATCEGDASTNSTIRRHLVRVQHGLRYSQNLLSVVGAGRDVRRRRRPELWMKRDHERDVSSDPLTVDASVSYNKSGVV